MAHFVFNLTEGDQQQAAALLDAKMWGISDEERYRDDVAPGDVALIYVPTPEGEFIGRVEIGTVVHEWTPPEAEVYPGKSPSGVLLSHVEGWNPVVTMDAVVRRIDPTASNPYVQANAARGFPLAVVHVTADEYEAAVALSREPPTT